MVEGRPSERAASLVVPWTANNQFLAYCDYDVVSASLQLYFKARGPANAHA